MVFSTPDVVFSGLGATTPIGGTTDEFWAGLLAGRSGVVTLDSDWAAALPARLAAPMSVDPAGVLDRVEARKLDRAMQAALVAARQAWTDAGLRNADVDPNRVAVVIGTGIGGATTLLNNHDALHAKGYRHVSPRMIQMNMPNGPAAVVSIEFDARAGAYTPISACASGSEAIAQALDLLRLDRADIVIAGGTEACIHEVTMAGFAQARAMSTRNGDPEHASRPFDVGRDGFVLGEGAGMVVLERATDATARGHRPYARLAGAGVTSDAFDMVSPRPDADGQTRAIRAALRDAGLSVTDIDHVNAHATSTPVGDLIEAAALREVFGEQVVVSATKSMTGHLLGAAGAIEAIATVLAVRDDIAPPTPTLGSPEPELGLDITRGDAVKTPIRGALSNSFGFGGHNAALIVTEL
jgi:3-oxoacyl-[acyl-carrier-protein] synthase II